MRIPPTDPKTPSLQRLAARADDAGAFERVSVGVEDAAIGRRVAEVFSLVVAQQRVRGVEAPGVQCGDVALHEHGLRRVGDRAVRWRGAEHRDGEQRASGGGERLHDGSPNNRSVMRSKSVGSA